MTCTLEVETVRAAVPMAAGDLQFVSQERLAEYIAVLERACRQEPHSADLHTCLGMAHALNEDIPGSLKSFEHARELEPEHFFAQFKYAELFYRLGALASAEQETRRAGRLARDRWQVAMVRRQLAAIRRLICEQERRRDRRSGLGMAAPVLLLVAVTAAAVIVLCW